MNDTIDNLSKLKAAAFSEEQANALACLVSGSHRDFVTTGQLDARLECIRHEFKASFADFRAEIFKWAVPILIGQVALAVALLKAFQ